MPDKVARAGKRQTEAGRGTGKRGRAAAREAPPAAPLLGLQQALGNRAFGRLLVQRAPREGSGAAAPAIASAAATSGEPAAMADQTAADPSPALGAADPSTAPSAAGPGTAEAAPASAPPTVASPVVEDEAASVGAGQMKKGEFLDRLEAEVRAAATAALAGTGHTTEDCPLLDFWLGYYRGQDAARINRDLPRMVPEGARAGTAAELIPLVAARVGESVATWAKTGEITGVPPGIPLAGMGMLASGGVLGAVAGLAGLLFKERPGGARAGGDPPSIRRELGAGQPLDATLRSRMESAFGQSFSHVRVHDDARAAGLAERLNARAFTLGPHVAFGGQEYRPGTLAGDALIAHELAHVVQQRGAAEEVAPAALSGGETSALEADADAAAAGVVASLWGKVPGAALAPRLRSGLGLQRCSKKSGAEPLVDKIEVIDSPAGAVHGFHSQRELGRDPLQSGDLDKPGPYNDRETGAVSHVVQVKFHLGQGSSEDLTPHRLMARTASQGVGQGLKGRNDPPDRPGARGGFRSETTAVDKIEELSVRRPSNETIVVADAPGFAKVDAYPAIYKAHFEVFVSSAEEADVARADYDVLIEKTDSDNIPNQENRLVRTLTMHTAKGAWPLRRS